jgi:hypothetical protein
MDHELESHGAYGCYSFVLGIDVSAPDGEEDDIIMNVTFDGLAY